MSVGGMIIQFALRGDTLARWLEFNPILADRELVLEKDTNKFKIGDGVSNYFDLPYGGLVGPQGPMGAGLRIIGTVITVGVNPQVTLLNTFPNAILGDGVIDVTNKNLWVYNESLWVNTGELYGPTGPVGPTGPEGAASTVVGPTGPTGPVGTGIAIGGTTGQALIKTSNVNYATGWGDVVTPTGAQTLSNKTLNSGTVINTYTEKIFSLSGTSPDLNPGNGPIQTWTLTGNSTPGHSFAAGQSLTLLVSDGTGFSITWPSVTWKTDGGTPPVLNTTGYTAIQLWSAAGTLFGARVGNA